MNFIRRVWLLLLIAITLTSTNVIIANEVISQEFYDFSSFSEDDAINYVKEQGIMMPEGLEDIEGYEAMVLEIIQEAYMDENYIPRYNNVTLYQFASDIVASVNKHTDYNDRESHISACSTSYVLQHSTQYGEWKDAYLKYNCYGYSIGRNIYQNPGYYSGYSLSLNDTITDIVYYTQLDLRALGYVVRVSTTCPTSLSVGQQLICVRMEDYDFHFMKYMGGRWYHKPFYTNPLKFNYSSANFVVWTNEAICRDETWKPTRYYDSDIYYITYWLSTSNDEVGTASFEP